MNIKTQLEKWFGFFIIAGLLLAACGPVPISGGSPALAFQSGQGGDGPILVGAPAGATPTPTPFQPLPPTPVYYPTDAPVPTPTPESAAEPTPFPQDPSAPVGALSLPPDQVNILLLGSDARPHSRNFRTDVIMLATITPSKGTINLTSFPRDLYINIPGWGMDRINTSWAHGGFDKLAATFEYNFGVRPEYYVLVNFSSFKQILDSLGGLEVDVDRPVSDYYRNRYITINPGRQHMDADLALWYVRTRKTTNDFARTRRQQEVLMALVEKFMSLNAIRRAPEFYNIYKDNVTTDLSLSDLLPLLPLAAQLTDSSRIHRYYIGPNHVSDWITPGGGMVLLPNKAEVQKIIRKALSGE